MYERYIDELNSRDIIEVLGLQKARNGGYICPICRSGDHGKGTGGLAVTDDHSRITCFAGQCFGEKGEDVLGALCKITGQSVKDVILSYFPQAEAETPQNNAAERPRNDITPKGNETAPTEEKDFTGYFLACRERLNDPRAQDYLKSRGISEETAYRYCMGFDPDADPAGAGHPTPRMILPTCKGHYVARSIDPATPAAYQKMNPKGCTPGIFNIKALQKDYLATVFVTEGIFDALSIIEAGHEAIALNSTANASKLISALEKEPTTAKLILVLDNDEAGRKAQKELQKGLDRLNIAYISADISGKYKDPNEALTADKEAFIHAVETATTGKPDAVSKYIEYLLGEEILEFTKGANLQTGFANLDVKAGGIYAGLYVIPAVSSLGKTTLALQIADNIAASGNDVLFFSLEMSRLEMVTKSIARKTAQKDMETAVTSLQIRKGYLPPHVLEAAREYVAEIQDHLSIIEGNFSCNVTRITDYVRQYIKTTGAKPVVFVDYLQILQGDEAKASTKETVDRSITTLKDLSREEKIPVFLVSSVNRTNYQTPIDFESIKESGNIEYTADVVWGLQFQVLNNEKIFGTADKTAKLKEKRDAIKKAKAETPRKIELVCLKNRYGIASFSCFFDYYPAHDLFVATADASDFDEETPVL